MFYVSKAFDRVWHAVLLNKLNFDVISGQIFCLTLSFLSNRRLLVVLDGKSSQEYSVNPGVPQGSILVPKRNDLLDDVIYNIVIYADYILSTLSDHASDLWQQLELAPELEFDLGDTMDWGRKWLVDFNAGKTQLISFECSINTGAIDVKIDESALEEIVLYLYRSIIRPYMESCCYVWTCDPSCYLEVIDKLQKRVCRTVGPSLVASLEPFNHRWNVTSLSLFYRNYFDRTDSTGFFFLFSWKVYSLFW